MAGESEIDSAQGRRDRSREQAEAAAPRPKGSYLTYGMVGIAAVGVAVWAVAAFYDVSLRPYGLAVVALLAAAFVGGLVLRGVRKARHRQALRVAYAEREPVAGSRTSGH